MGCCGGAKRVASGAAGLATYAMALRQAPAEVIDQRRAICRANTCGKAVLCKQNVSKFCVCRACGCLLKAKTANADESCPEGLWREVDHA